MIADLPPIETDIPIPPARTPTGYADLLRKLKVGESVLLPVLPGIANVYGHRVLGAGNYRLSKEQGGTRIWRAA